VDRLARLARSPWVRLFVTVALLAIIATQIDWAQAWDRVEQGSWSWFAAAAGFFAVGQIFGALRWHLLVVSTGIPARWPESGRAYAIGLFFNNFLPTAIGGDAARALVIGRSGPRLAKAFTSVVIDRTTSILCLIAVSWIVLLTHPGPVPGTLIAALGLATLAVVAALGLLLLIGLRSRGRLVSWLPESFRRFARDAREGLRLSISSPRLLAGATGLGLIFQFFAIASFWAVARAVGVDLPYSLMAVAMPLILLISLFPISIAGFGVREGGMVLVLGAAGVSATDATVISLTGVVAVMLATLPGGLALLLPGPRPLAGEPSS
jgi:glycosyltransferase 2 family protein